MKFSYEDLSDSQFETLIIHLCQRLLGVSLQGFAKGPDGGRDAKFIGTAELHPSKTVPWAGTTIIQAKHTNGHNRNFSESDFFSTTAANTVLGKEIPRIKKLRETKQLDHYMLFAIRRLAGNTSPLQIHALMLEAAPEPFDKNIVQRSTPSIHANRNACALEHARERSAGELGALIAVEDLRLPVQSQRIFQAIDAERGVQAVADPPAQYPPQVPVDDRHQINETSQELDVRNVDTPNLIGPADLHAAQQVGINCLLGMSHARRRPRRHPSQPHMTHQPLHPLAVCDIFQSPKKNHHPAAAVKRPTRVFLIHQPAQQQILLALLARRPPSVERSPCHPCQFALPHHRQFRLSLYPAYPCLAAHSPDFF